jgi:sterol desaturase/sphingolipid hydroxylase (fatty acid hydroxylase superfamily)
MCFGLVFFSALYLITGALNFLLIKIILPFISYGKPLDPRPFAHGQIRRELILSSLSIFIFGTGLIFPWGLLQLGWAKLGAPTSSVQVALEIVVLLIWNEIHFYINHRLLHTRFLRRFHLPHHRSIVTTPWSTYSFHPIEAMMLGNVVMLPMCLYDFSFTALLALPVFSIVFNNIGHSNYDFLPDAKHDRWWLNGARRHHLHHACYQGNFGFMLPFMDRLCKTELAINAADKKLVAGVKHDAA